MPDITFSFDAQSVDYAALHDALIEDDFHNGRSVEQYRISFQNTHTVVIAYDGDRIVGTTRALSDGVCNAYIVDVWTKREYRRMGIGREMMRLTVEKLAGQHISLWTDDRMDFYDRIGFERSEDVLFEMVSGNWLENETRDA